MVHTSVFQHKSPFYTSLHSKERSADYRVFINGTEAEVYACRISAYPFNRVWPGFQRNVDQTEIASFVNIVSDETITVEIEPKSKNIDGKIMIKPYSKAIQWERVGDRIRFQLTENGGYVFQIDDYHELLYLFNNKPLPCEDPDSVTYFFGAGVHFPGKIRLKSNDVVYLDKDAYVYGCLFAENAENIRIYGNGIFDDSCEERMPEAGYDSYVNGNVKFYDCRNLCLEGVGFTNSALWCVSLYHCFDATLDGIRIFGQWRYNTDGIDTVNCRRIHIKNCFVHSFDDAVTVKGTDRYSHENCQDILVEGCILWCDWGKTCELGLETAAFEYKNITFRNCDVLRGGNTVCDIQNGDYADIHHILFEDLRVDLEAFYTPEVMQREETQTYEEKDQCQITRILSIHNKRFREIYAFLGLSQPDSERKPGDPLYAAVRNVTVRNISLYCDPTLVDRFGNGCAKIFLLNAVPTSQIAKIRVENVFLNGKKLSPDKITVSSEGIEEGTLTVE